MAKAGGRRAIDPQAQTIALLDQHMHGGSEWHELGLADRLAVIEQARALSVLEFRQHFLTHRTDGERDLIADVYSVLTDPDLR